MNYLPIPSHNWSGMGAYEASEMGFCRGRGSCITVTHFRAQAISFRTFNFYATPLRGLESVSLQDKLRSGTAALTLIADDLLVRFDVFFGGRQ